MKRIVIPGTIVAALLACSPADFAQSALKIGVFDPQRVSEETEEGKKVQADLTALRDKKQAEISAREKDLTDLQSQLTEEALSLSTAKRSALEKEIQKKALEIQQAREGARNEMQFELASAQNKFQDKLLAVVEQFGRDEGFTIILDRSMAAYATTGIDVTTAIVDRFNAAVKPQGAPKPDATPPPAKGGGH